MNEVNSTSNMKYRLTGNLERKKRPATIPPEYAESSHVKISPVFSFNQQENLILKYPLSDFFFLQLARPGQLGGLFCARAKRKI